jgi:tetratricopeptide (TPR) repeat protein
MKDGDALVSIDPKNDEYQLERAYGHGGLGFMLEQKGELEEASQHYRVSLGSIQLLAQHKPGDADTQAELARAFNKVGVNLYNQGDLRGSIDYLRREADIYRALVAREPKQTDWKQRLDVSLAFLGRSADLTGDWDAARRLGQEELKIASELAEHDPANVAWQQAMASAMMRLGWVEASRGEETGFDLLRRARTKIDDVVRQAPEVRSYAIDRGMITARYGHLLAVRGDRRGIALLTESVRLLEQYPDDRGARRKLGWSLIALGEAQYPTRPKAAIAAWERADRTMPPASAVASPEELADRTRLLIRLSRTEDARTSLARLRKSGYATSELERLCREQGC